MDDFHKHLDECEQCREHPFHLCDKGAKILRKQTNKFVQEFYEHPAEDRPKHPFDEAMSKVLRR